MRPTKISSPYQPTEKQAVFHAHPARYRLYGGAAGGGKSEAILWEAMAQAIEIPGNRGLLLRKTYPELYETLIRRAKEKVPIGTATFHETRHELTFYNGSSIKFSHCDDVTKFQSAEFGFIGIDELTHFTEYEWRYLLSRLRTINAQVFPNAFAATNPGGIGHAWVKRLWIDEPTAEFGYIPARVYDNPYLMAADPAYIQRLEQLPENDRRALLEGDWDVFAGQVFNEFRREVHVMEPFTISQDCKRFRAVDYGYAAPYCCLWFAILPAGDLIIYREEYIAGLTAEQQAERMKALSVGEDISYTVVDPSVYQKTGHLGESISQIYNRCGIPTKAGDNDRISGWNRLHAYLAHSEGRPPRLRIFSTCQNLIRTLPQLIYDEHRVEDVNTDCEDHAPDAARYGMMSRPNPFLGNVVGMTPSRFPFPVTPALDIVGQRANTPKFPFDEGKKQRDWQYI